MNSPPDDPHYHCEPGEDCVGGCGVYICPRCNPSPQNDGLCGLCYWIEDPGTPGLDGDAA